MASPLEQEIHELLRAAIELRGALKEFPWEFLENRPALAASERRLDLAIEAIANATS
jgi:hypothetical protein